MHYDLNSPDTVLSVLCDLEDPWTTDKYNPSNAGDSTWFSQQCSVYNGGDKWLSAMAEWRITPTVTAHIPSCSCVIHIQVMSMRNSSDSRPHSSTHINLNFHGSHIAHTLYAVPHLLTVQKKCTMRSRPDPLFPVERVWHPDYVIPAIYPVHMRKGVK